MSESDGPLGLTDSSADEAGDGDGPPLLTESFSDEAGDAVPAFVVAMRLVVVHGGDLPLLVLYAWAAWRAAATRGPHSE